MPLITKGDLSLSGLMSSTESAANRALNMSDSGAEAAMKAAERAKAIAERDRLTAEDALKRRQAASEAMDVAYAAVQSNIAGQLGLDKLFSAGPGAAPITLLK